MEKTFREKIILCYRSLIKKHRRLRIPAFVMFSVVLGFHDGLERLVGGWRRYAFTAFLVLMFLVGSSFTYPVFGGDQGFISTEEQPRMAPLSESTIAPAVDEEADAEVLRQREEGLAEDAVRADDAVRAGDDVPTNGDGQAGDAMYAAEDVRTGYQDAEFHGSDELDKYSLEEILDGSRFTETDQSESIGSATGLNFQTDDWRLILINKQHPIPDGYAVALGTIKGSMQCDERIINDLLSMLQGAKDDRINLIICSPFRDISRQEMLFESKINTYMRKGMSYLEAYRLSSQSVTVPGASEHQLGLAIDIVSDDYAMLDAGFAETAAGQWLSDHSAEYGFILRYPAGKEYITGIDFEPWHFRYVGKEAATVITEQGITLEEFVDKYL